MADAREKPRNMLSSDDLIGYLISKGQLVDYHVMMASPPIVYETRVVVSVVIDIPARYSADSPGYERFALIGQGISLGHAHQQIYDQAEINL